MSELEPTAEEAPNFAKAEMTFEQFARRMNGEIARYSAALAASDLERIRLRAGLREALDGWALDNDPPDGVLLPSIGETEDKIAELRKLVSE